MTCLALVKEITSDGKFHSLVSLAQETGYPATSVSARLRELRSLGFTVDRKKDGRCSTFRYRVSPERQLFTTAAGSRKCKCTSCGGRGFKRVAAFKHTEDAE